MSNLFVISGGPGSGKTKVLEQLEVRGFRTAPEVARQIIQEQVRLGGTALPGSDHAAYARLMLEPSIESYLAHAPELGPTFCNRGIPDTLGYARLIGLADDPFTQDACRRYRYAPHVFMAPP